MHRECTIAEVVATRTLEQLVTDSRFLGLPASAHQRFACRIASGTDAPLVPPLPHWGTEVMARTGSEYMWGSAAPLQQPRELYLIVGVRTGKSLLAAVLAIRAALTCDLSGIAAHEVPRVSVLSLRRDLAQVIREHLNGVVTRSPLLSAVIVPDASDCDTLVVQHPSGRRVEIAIVAGARAGSAVVARWSAGVIIDEAPRFASAVDSKINFEDVHAASLSRLLPGAQVIAIGSPWAAYGPVYEIVQKYWRRPADGVAVLRCAAPPWNMRWWSTVRVAEVREANPLAYRADVLGEFVDLTTDALAAADVEACRGDGVFLSPKPRHVHVAAMDPGIRRNAWTVIVARRNDDGGVEVCLARQWLPPAHGSLDPAQVLLEMAELLRPYGIAQVYTDQHSADAIKAIARRHKLVTVMVNLRQDEKLQLIAELAAKLALRQVWLPDCLPLIEDLKRIRRVATSGSRGLRIEYPETADGRHCDYAPALLLAMRHLVDPEPERPPGYDPEEEALVKRLRRRGQQIRAARATSRRF